VKEAEGKGGKGVDFEFKGTPSNRQGAAMRRFRARGDNREEEEKGMGSGRGREQFAKKRGKDQGSTPVGPRRDCREKREKIFESGWKSYCLVARVIKKGEVTARRGRVFINLKEGGGEGLRENQLVIGKDVGTGAHSQLNKGKRRLQGEKNRCVAGLARVELGRGFARGKRRNLGRKKGKGRVELAAAWEGSVKKKKENESVEIVPPFAKEEGVRWYVGDRYLPKKKEIAASKGGDPSLRAEKKKKVSSKRKKTKAIAWCLPFFSGGGAFPRGETKAMSPE